MKQLFETIIQEMPELNIHRDESMHSHCSFRIGGPADIFVLPKDEKELSAVLAILRREGVKPFILGNGTNLLVRDEGIRGVVIKLAAGFDTVERSGNTVYAGCGATLARTAVFAQNNGLGGMEFAHGIPGSVGGAVYMNAGAYGGEMKDIVKSVRYINAEGEICESSENDFSYRHSRFSDSDDVILGATLELYEADPADIGAKMRELMEKRSASQPLEKPSAGSTFKRPVGGYAAAMIDECGLKGYTIGGAQVSAKHAGFVINAGGATFADVMALIEHIQKTVHEKFGTQLETEVKIIG
ncbi:MAG: UDP-N-acetylmuramate dehydrogenase [Oscillospiraceae bacterium]|nr:UDP-N-acetylmuramate dehydrogenase [Oscillospiraceae bacterium]MBR5261188.1 UDP-N-acetylmuramate dehydrogenase [Oscillospiraceae bacterium]